MFDVMVLENNGSGGDIYFNRSLLPVLGFLAHDQTTTSKTHRSGEPDSVLVTFFLSRPHQE